MSSTQEIKPCILPTFPVLLRLNCLMKRVCVHITCTLWWYDICTLWNIYHSGLLWWLSSNLPVSAGVLGSIPASKRSPREGNGNRTSIRAWENPWGEEPGGPQSIGLQKSCTWLSNSKHTSTPNSHVCVCVCVCVVRMQDFLSANFKL